MKPAPAATLAAARTAGQAGARSSQVPRQQISSEELLRGQRELLIEHAGELYSLRQTSKGKLILTK